MKTNAIKAVRGVSHVSFPDFIACEMGVLGLISVNLSCGVVKPSESDLRDTQPNEMFTYTRGVCFITHTTISVKNSLFDREKITLRSLGTFHL